jgi:hypothetical protein
MLKYFFAALIITAFAVDLKLKAQTDCKVYRINPKLKFKFKVHKFSDDFCVDILKQNPGTLQIPNAKNVAIELCDLNKVNIYDYILEINKINIASSVHWEVPAQAIELLPELGNKCPDIRNLTLVLKVEDKKYPDVSRFKKLSNFTIIICFKNKSRKIIEKGELLLYAMSKEEQNYLNKLVNYIASLNNFKKLAILAHLMDIDLTSFKNQRHLESLKVDTGKLTFPENLGTMKNLSFSCQFVNNFSTAVNSFKTLSSLKCKITIIPTFVSLPEMPDLELLDLSWNKFCRIKLNNMQKLKKLRLKYCFKLTAIAGLKNVNSLQVLELQAQNFKDSAALKTLHNLKSLNLACCKNIDSLEFLTKLQLLQELNLYGCSGINDFSPIAKLDNLKKLNIAGCKIKNYDFLRSLSNLEKLYISSNLTIESFRDKVNPNCKIIQMSFFNMPFWVGNSISH